MCVCPVLRPTFDTLLIFATRPFLAVKHAPLSRSASANKAAAPFSPLVRWKRWRREQWRFVSVVSWIRRACSFGTSCVITLINICANTGSRTDFYASTPCSHSFILRVCQLNFFLNANRLDRGGNCIGDVISTHLILFRLDLLRVRITLGRTDQVCESRLSLDATAGGLLLVQPRVNWPEASHTGRCSV